MKILDQHSRDLAGEPPSTFEAGGGDPRLRDDPYWQTAERVTRSKGFAKSKFLCRFILYICEKHLLGQVDEITEQQIGEQVFDRPAGYSPGDDNIVRNYARLLRQRLENYFAQEGASERIRIAVPRGKYVPLFIERDALISNRREDLQADSDQGWAESSGRADELSPSSAENLRSISQPSSLLGWKILSCFLLLSLVTLSFYTFHSSPKETPADRFWTMFFKPSQDTLLIPADSGLALYEDLARKTIPLSDYVNGEFRRETSPSSGLPAAMINELGSRRYTSVVDLQLVATISQLRQASDGRLRIRYAREVALDDIKQSNVILLGSVDANPWVELFQDKLVFRFEQLSGSGVTTIHNRHPHAGEREFYQTDQTDPSHLTFGLIAVVPNLDGRGRVLLIEGINMAGTKAAADYLFSDEALPVLSQIVASNDQSQAFEVLLRTSNIGANTPHPQVVAQRVGAE